MALAYFLTVKSMILTKSIDFLGGQIVQFLDRMLTHTHTYISHRYIYIYIVFLERINRYYYRASAEGSFKYFCERTISQGDVAR